jgi:hypothetical protein
MLWGFLYAGGQVGEGKNELETSLGTAPADVVDTSYLRVTDVINLHRISLSGLYQVLECKLPLY